MGRNVIDVGTSDEVVWPTSQMARRSHMVLRPRLPWARQQNQKIQAITNSVQDQRVGKVSKKFVWEAENAKANQLAPKNHGLEHCLNISPEEYLDQHKRLGIQKVRLLYHKNE